MDDINCMDFKDGGISRFGRHHFDVCKSSKLKSKEIEKLNYDIKE